MTPVPPKLFSSFMELKYQLRWLTALPGIRWFEITKRRLGNVMQSSGQFRLRTPRRYWLVLVAAAVLLLPAASRNITADEGATDEKNHREDGKAENAAKLKKSLAAEIMQGVYGDLEWIDSAQSFHIRTKYKFESMENPQAPNGQNGLGPPPAAGAGMRRPRKNDDNQPDYMVFQWAWDRSRVLSRTEGWKEGKPEATYENVKIWDGSLGISYGGSPGKPNSYSISNKVETFFGNTTNTTGAYRPWGLGGAHNIWWQPTDVREHRFEYGILPEDFELAGEETLNGRRCRVLESKLGMYRMYVGADDGRLYRRSCLAATNKGNDDYLKLLQKFGGAKIKSTWHLSPWLDGLEPAERRRVWREINSAQFDKIQVIFSQDFGDYREVAPGRSLPFRHHSDHYGFSDEKAFLSHQTDQVVMDVSVDQPLPEKLFKIDLQNGVQVRSDHRYDPSIDYLYDDHQTDDDRQALADAKRIAEAKASEERERLDPSIKSRLGTEPTALPAADWLIGKPMSWEALRGKVVVLHFWDARKTEGQVEMLYLQNWHEKSAENNVVVIGIHRQTKDLDAVKNKVDELGVTFPVIVDSPLVDEKKPGVLHDWFHIPGRQNTVLIDKRGKVAEHGYIWPTDISEKLRRLTAEQ